MEIAVLGAGAWGTSIAVQLARHHAVQLWTREKNDASAMQQTRYNQRYLPDVVLPASMQICAGVATTADLAACDLVMVACPVVGLREQLAALHGLRTPLVWLCKGFEEPLHSNSFGLLAHEVMAQVAPQLTAGVLSGPSFAQEVAQGQPTALVVASPHEVVRTTVVRALHSETLRVYSSDDLIGVEVGGAVKNVLAIAAGVLDGLREHSTDAAGVSAPGLNARAALLTRGLAEMTRFGVALGAQPLTFMGLSGMGDLVLTATGNLSRNRSVGLLLAKGLTAQQAVATLGHVAEGVYCAKTVLDRATTLQIDMPVTRCVVELLNGEISAQEAVRQLMARDARPESDV